MRYGTTLLFLAACSRASPDPGLISVPAPTASATSLATSLAPPAASSAAPAPKPSPSLVLVGGDLVDLGSMSVARTLTTDMVFAHAIAGATAYLWARGDLRAYDAVSGALRWSKPIADCWVMAASNDGALCGGNTGVIFFRKADGSSSKVGVGTGVAALVGVGGKFVAVYGDKRVEAFDAAGTLAGATTAPVVPDRGYAHVALEVGGAFACGVQRSDASSTVFCLDATPRVVWSKTSVPGGALTQVDGDVVVVASDTWAKAPSSDVLRTSDGAPLLHVSGVRLAAALTTGGALDGALATDPITLFDATGAAKWTAPATSIFHGALRAVRAGPNLAIAQFSPIATGTQLFALDAATGALAWRASVDSLPISHSKYSNEVTLRDANKTLLLLGHESSQDYAQTFDPATGRRLGSVVRGR